MKKIRYMAISRENGNEREVSEENIRKSLSGNYKNIDLAIKTLNDLGQISTSFEIFKKIKPKGSK